MSVITRPATEATPRLGLVRRVMRLRAVAAVLAIVGAPIVFGGAAFASVPDPTGGAGDTFVTGLTAWVTTYGVPLAFGLLLLGVIIRVAIKFAKRGARAL